MKFCEPKYVSCIKINGIPILPPLITHAKRKEIHRYKLQAMKLEKRIKRERELRQYIDRYYTPTLETCTNLIVTTSLEHKLAFEDDLISQINDLENEIKEIQGKKCIVINQVPPVVQKRTPCLSCDLQVSQYANNKFTVLTSFGKCKSDIVAINGPLYIDKDDSFVTQSSQENEVDISDLETNKPRLIRSNSYILDSPSPMLLEHLRKQTESVDVVSHDGASLPQVSQDIQNITESNSQLDMLTLRTKDNCVCQEDNGNLDDSSYINLSRTESDFQNISPLSDQISTSEDFTLIGTQYQLKAFIDNNVPQVLDNKVIQIENSRETKSYSTNSNKDYRILNSISNSSPPAIIPSKWRLTEYSEGDLKQILNDIPDVYSKQIVEFLEKQKQELLKVKGAHDSSLDEVEEIFDKVEGSSYISKEEPMSYFNYDHIQVIETEDKNVKRVRNETMVNCSRELFPTSDIGKKEGNLQDKKTSPTGRQHTLVLISFSIIHLEYAASIIGAAIRGYLVRRLMRTDRVQGLIQTIRDALICAMQLHSENNDSINESDVELHRRLIQQVSAACYGFYDVFFTLSISEQMTIIRVDRERQKEKLKRPLSRVSSTSSRISRSTSKLFEN
ncbi:hypothetical protein Trydic_g17063 [Trypoxylus dichotomus]